MTVEISKKDVKKLTQKASELVKLMQHLGLINISRQPPKPKLKIVKNENVESAKVVLDYYREIHPSKGKGVKPGHRMFKLIQARLEDGYSVSELKLAIDGNKIEPWHASRAAGAGLDFIFRNQSKVDQFIEEATNPSKGLKNEKTGYNSGSSEFDSGLDGFGDESCQ